MVDYVTPDLCDAYSAVRVLTPMFKSFGGRSSFGGQVVTVKCFEDNSRVKELLATAGTGKVLVVDGGGSLRCAFFVSGFFAQNKGRNVLTNDIQ